MNAIILVPGEASLADWRAIYRGATARLDGAAAPRIAQSAAAVARILAKGEPVYGINTGFGKLASVRIGDEDLATLQRNIVLSHAAGTGAPSPVPVIRLMMALKLASLELQLTVEPPVFECAGDVAADGRQQREIFAAERLVLGALA